MPVRSWLGETTGLPESILEATEVVRFRQVDPIRVARSSEPPSTLARLDADTSLVHAVALADRAGVEKFLAILEHEHFNPLSAREPLLQARCVAWMGMSWCLASIPSDDWRLIHGVAARCGLRAADGTPTAILADRILHWPMRSSRCRQLENVGVAGGGAMPGAPGHAAARAAEDRECEAIRDVTRRRYRGIIPGN